MAQPIVIEQTVAGGVPQSVTVPAVSYDYSQPIDTQAPPPEPAVADPAVAKFDEGRAAFKTGDYVTALQPPTRPSRRFPTTPRSTSSGPWSCSRSEVRASRGTALRRALGRARVGLDDAHGGLYPRVDVYTQQLRAPGAVRADEPKSSAARFVLAYHYMTQGNNDAAAPAQAGGGPGAAGHPLRTAHQAVLAARDGTRNPAGATAPPPSTTAVKQAYWPGTGPPTRPGNHDRPAPRGRRDLHLEGRLQGQASATRRKLVAH